MKILLIRLSSIGDVLLTTPFLRALARAMPEAELHYVTKAPTRPLVEGHPALMRVHTYEAEPKRRRELKQELLGENFDLVIDLHAVPRSRALRSGLAPRILVFRKHPWRWIRQVLFKWKDAGPSVPIPERYIATAASLGLEPDGEGLDLHLPSSLHESAAARLRDRGWDGHRPLIALCPGSRHATKRWPLEHQSALIRLLAVEGWSAVLLGGAGESEGVHGVSSTIDLCGCGSLLDTAAVMDHCAVVVTNDSGLMHLASARRRPQVALFGSTVREFGFSPYHARAIVLEHPTISCRPCTHIGRARCPHGHFRCMRELTPSSVLHAIRSLLP